MPKISLIIHTASPDDFLAKQGIPSYFHALIHNLSQQTFRDFELVYVDTYWDVNRKKFTELSRYHPIKHVRVHPDHRYWYDRDNCYIAAAKNTGILYADGDLCVSCDDAEFFPATFLERYWHNYRQGRYLHALHKRLRSITIPPDLVGPLLPITGDEYVNDKRWEMLLGDELQHGHGSLCFAGTSFSLADALQLNGYNERLDGCKSLDDCDFGGRLASLGRSFIMEKAGHLFILDHGSYSDDADCGWTVGEQPLRPVHTPKKITNFIAVENYGLLRACLELQDLVANQNPLTERHWEIIREDTIKYRSFDPLGPENAEKLEIWKGTPTFNLKQQREELRSSAAWEWL